jgi:hypothetical protein
LNNLRCETGTTSEAQKCFCLSESDRLFSMGADELGDATKFTADCTVVAAVSRRSRSQPVDERNRDTSPLVFFPSDRKAIDST